MLPKMKKFSDLLFEIILFGLKVQETITATKYAFSKFDLIFTPPVGEFYSACENPGMISFKDAVLSCTSNMMHKLLQSIVWHEMGHMWYAVIITNTWWSETWIKEAFADWLAWHTCNAWWEAKLGVYNAEKLRLEANEPQNWLCNRMSGCLCT